jgi:hypothetical protein
LAVVGIDDGFSEQFWNGGLYFDFQSEQFFWDLYVDVEVEVDLGMIGKEFASDQRGCAR